MQKKNLFHHKLYNLYQRCQQNFLFKAHVVSRQMITFYIRTGVVLNDRSGSILMFSNDLKNI